jgi:hypothetical protein
MGLSLANSSFSDLVHGFIYDYFISPLPRHSHSTQVNLFYLLALFVVMLYLLCMHCSVEVSSQENGNRRIDTLTPKGPGVPYVGFSDSGQAAVNAFYF